MNPVEQLQTVIRVEGQGPVFYLHAALYALSDHDYIPDDQGLDWLIDKQIDSLVVRVTMDAMYGADGQHLDLDDAYPHVVLWCLRVNGYLKPVDGLDTLLQGWRARNETAAGEPFWWLPCFPENRRLYSLLTGHPIGRSIQPLAGSPPGTPSSGTRDAP